MLYDRASKEASVEDVEQFGVVKAGAGPLEGSED